MMPMKDMFYGMAEPVWIMSHSELDGQYDTDEDEIEAGFENEQEVKARTPGTRTPRTPRIHFDRYHSEGHYLASPAYKFDDTDEKVTEVVMKVPICCGECEDSVKVALYDRLVGVKSVKCDIYREMVTVVATEGAPADVLMECKRVFKKSRMWSDDD